MHSEINAKTRDRDDWHRLEADAVVQRLASDAASGLDSSAVKERRRQFGRNQLPVKSGKSWKAIIIDQFSDLMILILIAAAVISGFVGEPGDTIAIIVIVVLNALIGGIQAYRAERALAALRMMVTPEAKVLRDGTTRVVDAASLVPGDVVYLEAGMIAPADMRLLDVAELQVDESVLTGESVVIDKQSAAIGGNVSLPGEKLNMVFKGTQVAKGRAIAVVTATGLNTELGRIASLLEGKESIKTPLQQRLTRFGGRLAMFVLAVCVVIFIAGLLRGEPVVLMFLTSVSLAVAAIPEALPAVVTIALAFGARKMSRHQALVRHLPSVETLGSVTMICSDKTGTLTENRMHLEQVYIGGHLLDKTALQAEEYQRFWQALALSNDVEQTDRGEEQVLGEPTELALYKAAHAAGYDKHELQTSLPRVAEIPFDAERKSMTTLHRDGERFIAFTKGAPECVLPHCAATHGDTSELMQRAENLAAEGFRVLALATRQWDSIPETLEAAQVERELAFLALVALIDPPREEAQSAVQECISAGIKPVMITGDHPSTARAIAARIGLVCDEQDIMTGEELETLSATALERKLEHVQVFARVSPEQKIDIVRGLQQRGEFVAMTGDGVNDAPALRHANIGVAMGLKGTDVAREAADMVLLDDNFATIVTAVREGRRIFDNIRKFIKDTMSSNSGEIWTLFLAPFLGLPVPLLPIHILWINLVTDGLPGLAFTQEPAERGIMQRPPRPPKENIFAHGMWQHIIWVGLFVGGISIASQAWAISRGVEYWQTVVFTVLTISQLFHSMAVRSERESLFTIGVTSNRYMLGAVLLTVLLQLLVIYHPLLNPIFKTQPLPMFDLGICFLLSSLVLVAVELEKWLIRRGWLYTQA